MQPNILKNKKKQCKPKEIMAVIFEKCYDIPVFLVPQGHHKKKKKKKKTLTSSSLVYFMTYYNQFPASKSTFLFCLNLADCKTHSLVILSSLY